MCTTLGSGKTHIAVLRIQVEAEREPSKVINIYLLFFTMAYSPIPIRYLGFLSRQSPSVNSNGMLSTPLFLYQLDSSLAPKFPISGRTPKPGKSR